MRTEGSLNIPFEQLATIFKVLGEPNRLLLLNKIIEGIQCNCELGKSLSLSSNLVSHHLSVLCDSNLVSAKRDENDGRWIYYSVNEETFEQVKIFIDEFFNNNRIQLCKDVCGPIKTKC